MDTSSLRLKKKKKSVALIQRENEKDYWRKNVCSITVFPCLDLTDAGKLYFLTDLLNMEPAVPLQVIFQLSACFKCPHMPLSNCMSSLLLLPIIMNPDFM